MQIQQKIFPDFYINEKTRTARIPVTMAAASM
jgi:hypothetical protein